MSLILLFVSFIEKNISIFFVFSMLLFLSLILINLLISNKYKKIIIFIFVLVLFFNFISMIFSAYSFNYNLDNMLGANDEAKFYFESNRIAKSIIEKNELNLSNKFDKGYTLIIGIVSYIGDIFGNNSPISIKLLSVFAGAWISIFVFFIHKNYYNFHLSKKTAIYTGLFPTLMYYSSIGVRDIFVALSTTFFFFNLINKKNRFNFLWIIVSILCTYFLRVENAFFLVGVYLLYLFYYNIKFFNLQRILVMIILIVMLSSIFVAYNDFIINNTYKKIIAYQNSYMKMAQNNTNENSIGMKVARLPFPVNYIGRFGMGIIGSFPPTHGLTSPFIRKKNIDGFYYINPKLSFSIGRFMKFLGPIIWYFMLPFIFIGLFLFKKRNEMDINFINYMSILYIFLISTITVETGRIIPVYPILFSYGVIINRSLNRNTRLKTYIMTLIVLMIMMLVYVFLKY